MSGLNTDSCETTDVTGRVLEDEPFTHIYWLLKLRYYTIHLSVWCHGI